MDWDEYFITIAMAVKEKSKDPSSKIGAVIVGPDNEIRSTGFNGFPRGVDESDPERWERPIKYDYVEHAERNAIYNAARVGVSTKDCTLYLVGFGPKCYPCKPCTNAVIQAGIKRIVGFAYKDVTPGSKYTGYDFSKARVEEAGIEFVDYVPIAQSG